MTDYSIHRECPLCGNQIKAFRGCMVSKGIAPPKYIRFWNDDIKDCEKAHEKCELIDRSFLKGLYRLFNGKSFFHPNIEKAKERYDHNPSKV